MKKSMVIIFLLLLAGIFMIGWKKGRPPGYYKKKRRVTRPRQKPPITEHGLTFVHVPAGWFTMGGNNGDSDERPVHRVYLKGYYISKYEVTNAQYCAFLNAYGNSYQGHKCIDIDDEDCQIYYSNGRYYVKSGYENYPVIEVTWYGAKAFCEYYGWRLPTEAEWEKAARGTDGRKYPWGNHDPYYNGKYYANYDPGDYDADGYEYTAPVGSYPHGASPYGCMDMAGNVWEWCNDWYDSDYYSRSPGRNPQGPSSGSRRVLRGGSWDGSAGCIRCAYRYYYAPSDSWDCVGFRPVRDEK